jgi:hypothetical protein
MSIVYYKVLAITLYVMAAKLVILIHVKHVLAVAIEINQIIVPVIMVIMTTIHLLSA